LPPLTLTFDVKEVKGRGKLIDRFQGFFRKDVYTLWSLGRHSYLIHENTGRIVLVKEGGKEFYKHPMLVLGEFLAGVKMEDLLKLEKKMREKKLDKQTKTLLKKYATLRESLEKHF